MEEKEEQGVEGGGGEDREQEKMGQNVTGDVIPGCRNAPREDVLVRAGIEGNMERLTGRLRMRRHPDEETEIHSKRRGGGPCKKVG